LFHWFWSILQWTSFGEWTYNNTRRPLLFSPDRTWNLLYLPFTERAPTFHDLTTSNWASAFLYLTNCNWTPALNNFTYFQYVMSTT
jgi:hypothetical protein